MLERNSFLLLRQKQTSGKVYSILDCQTGEFVGAVRQRAGLLESALCLLTGRLPSQLDVLEQPDDSLVFTIRKTGFPFHSHFEVCDAMGGLVGSFSPHALTRGGFSIYDRLSASIAILDGQAVTGDYQFVNHDRTEQLACVSRETSQESEHGNHASHAADNFLLFMNPRLDDQPLLKMLLLSATLIADQFDKRSFPIRGINSLR
jgi:hypothetical protein